jgi:transcriptional regulator with XRE-family HTH domain
MARRTRAKPEPAGALSSLAGNLVAAIRRQYGRQLSPTAAYRRFAADTGTTLATVQRVVDGTASIGLDMLERFADALNVRVSDLLLGPDAARHADRDLDELVRIYGRLRLEERAFLVQMARYLHRPRR